MADRRLLVAGNWKMHATVEQATALSTELLARSLPEEVEVALFPPFTALWPVHLKVQGSALRLGAQNCHWEQAGAFTGEVSVEMLAPWCDYVLVGHSERRQYFGESDLDVERKSRAASAAGLTPVVCVGEQLREHRDGRAMEVVSAQIQGGLGWLQGREAIDLVVAYEPCWAIGTNLAAEQTHVGKVFGGLRELLLGIGGRVLAERTRILYGGSVRASNVADFVALEGCDGCLVGGASLDVEEFSQLVRRCAKEA